MTTQTASPEMNRTANIIFWVLQILLGLFFIGMAGLGKLTGQPDMVAMFDTIGIGQWFRYLTGLLEVGGGLLLLIPGFAAFGGIILSTAMLGAILSHIFILGGSFVFPLVLGIIAGIIVWGRKAQLQRLTG